MDEKIRNQIIHDHNGFCDVARDYAFSFEVERELKLVLPGRMVIDDEKEFLDIFSRVIRHRVLKYSSEQIDHKGNLLLKSSDFGISLIFRFFNSLEGVHNEFTGQKFNYHFGSILQDMRIDLATMTLYTMFLESGWVRMLIAMLNRMDTKEVFILFHNKLKSIYPYQIFFGAEQFASENVLKAKLFVREVHPATNVVMTGL
jgi:hypothetical protein